MLNPIRRGHIRDMVLILALASALQFWQLTHIPPGLDEDSAANGWVAVQWLRGGPLPFWNGRNGAAEPLMVWLQSATTWLWGPSILALRSVSAGAMALAAPVAYLLAWEVGRGLFSTHFTFSRSVPAHRSNTHGSRTPGVGGWDTRRWGARFAGILIAVGPVFIELGRTGLRATLLPLVSGLLFLALLYALRTNERRIYLATGLLLGLALYTYLAARLLPLVVGLFLLLRFWMDYAGKHPRKLHNQGKGRGNHAPMYFLVGCAWLVVGATLIALPQLLFFLGAPHALWARTDAVSIVQNPQVGELGYLGLLAHKFGAMARMIGLEWHGQYNQAGRPLLQPVAFAGFLAVWWPLRRALYAPGPQLMVMAGLLLLIPDLLGGDRMDPHSLRLIGSLLPLVVLSSLGLAWLVERSTAILGRIRAPADGEQFGSRRALAWGVALWLVAWGVVDWGMVISPRLAQSQFEWYAREDVVLARWINRQDEPVLVPVYLLSHPNLAYLTADRAGAPAGGLPQTALDAQAATPTAWLVLPTEPPRARVESTSYRYDPTALIWLDRAANQGRARLLPPVQPASLEAATAACDEWLPIVEETPPPALQAETSPAGWACRVELSGLRWNLPPSQTGFEADAGRHEYTYHDLAFGEILAEAAAGGNLPDEMPDKTPREMQGYLFHNDLNVLYAQADTFIIQPGAMLGVNTYWQALRTGKRDWRMYVHLVNDQGVRIAGEDFMPAYGFYGTEMWTPGAVIPLRQLLAVPPDLPPGRYWLHVGLYDPLGGDRSPIRPVATDRVATDTVVDFARFGPLKIPLPAPEPPADGKPVAAVFGDALKLHAYALDVAADQVTVTLQWEAIADIQANYTFFLHVVTPDESIVAQHDAQPLDGAYPTGIWQAGERIVTELTAVLPPDVIQPDTTETDDYALWLGAYEQRSGDRLPIVIEDEISEDGMSSDADRLLLR